MYGLLTVSKNTLNLFNVYVYSTIQIAVIGGLYLEYWAGAWKIFVSNQNKNSCLVNKIHEIFEEEENN